MYRVVASASGVTGELPATSARPKESRTSAPGTSEPIGLTSSGHETDMFYSSPVLSRSSLRPRTKMQRFYARRYVFESPRVEGSDDGVLTKRSDGQVARLESLVRYLVAQPITIAAPPVFSSNPRDFFASRSGPSSSEATSPSTHQTSVSPPPNFFPPPAPKDRSGTPPPLKDLRATDLCAALSQLAVREFCTLLPRPVLPNLTPRDIQATI